MSPTSDKLFKARVGEVHDLNTGVQLAFIADARGSRLRITVGDKTTVVFFDSRGQPYKLEAELKGT